MKRLIHFELDVRHEDSGHLLLRLSLLRRKGSDLTRDQVATKPGKMLLVAA